MLICFETNKLGAMQELAQDKGLNPSVIQNPDDQNHYFYVYDPSGVFIQLKEKLSRQTMLLLRLVSVWCTSSNGLYLR